MGSPSIVGQKTKPIGGNNVTPWWSDVSHDLLCFKGSYLHISKEFPAEYRALCSQSFLDIMNMTNTLLQRELLLQDVEQERYNKDASDLQVRLKYQMKTYSESQGMLQSLQQDEEKGGKRLKDSQPKSKEIYVEKKIL